MARQATYNVTTKLARSKLRVRPKPYYTQIAPNRTLGYIRTADGAGTWVYRWKADDGMYKRRKLGVADDHAQPDGRDVLAYDQAVRKATNPGAEAPAGAMTVAVALDRYFESHTSKHAKQYKAIADRHIVPTLGKHRVNKLTKTQIESWQASLVKDDPEDADVRRRSQDTANRILTHLKAALNRAFADDSNGIATDAAWRRVKPFQGVARARTDDLDPKEVRLLVAKTATFDKPLATLMEAAYLTGARVGELRNCKVNDLDFARRTLRVDGKTGQRTVTLTDETATFLRTASAGRKRDDALFAGAEGRAMTPADCARPVKRAVALADLPSSVSLYTLRHAHISRAIENGQPLKLIADNCGTSLMMIDKNYAHVLAHTRRDTIQRTAPKLRRAK